MIQAEVEGVVIGRVHRELIRLKTDRGRTATIRLLPEMGAELELGYRARVSFDESGRPCRVVVAKK